MSPPASPSIWTPPPGVFRDGSGAVTPFRPDLPGAWLSDHCTLLGCHVLLQGIFPTQGLNPHLLCLLHCRQILYPLNHLRSPLESPADLRGWGSQLETACLVGASPGKVLTRSRTKKRLKEKWKCLQKEFLLSPYLTPDHLLSKKEPVTKKMSPFIA